MKIQTGNRLAHYQCELQELKEQTMMLQQSLTWLDKECSNLYQYLQYNNGDRQARKKYSNKLRELRGTQAHILRNGRRMQNLQVRIQQEAVRIGMGR